MNKRRWKEKERKREKEREREKEKKREREKERKRERGKERERREGKEITSASAISGEPPNGATFLLPQTLVINRRRGRRIVKES